MRITLAFLLLSVLSLQGQNLPTQLFQNDRAFTRQYPVTFNPEWAPFFHGVASGDPLTDRVIIWTRITPEEGVTGPLTVNWQVASDPLMEQVLQSGSFETNADRDYTVKVDVAGLTPGTTYYYHFEHNGIYSLTGKTKTTPQSGIDHLKFAVVSCSNFQAGFFNAYGHLAKRNDLDAVIHLGDYIYEYPDGLYGNEDLFDERPIEPETEILSLEEYRTRYSTYRLDTNLVRVHQQHPFITVWDDHESANDAYKDGAENHDPATEGDWESRKAQAKQVYFEWMPIRDEPDQRVYRAIQYGDLVDLIMLDTRLEGRDKQIDDVTDPNLADPTRTILGAEQKAWLLDQLANSTATWKVIGQQVMFAELNVGWATLNSPGSTYEQFESIFLDIWDGYPLERAELLSAVSQAETDNVVVLTGDVHSAFAYDVPSIPVQLQFQDVPPVGTLPFYLPVPEYDPATGAGSVLVEFVTPSITSANFDENLDPLTAFGFQVQINNPINLPGGITLGNPNPHMKYVDLIQHGYYILDVKPDSVQANWYFTDIAQPTQTENFGAARYALNAENHLLTALAPSAPKAVQDVPAPFDPVQSSGTVESSSGNLAVMGVYPNPFSAEHYLHFSVRQAGKVRISLVDDTGKEVSRLLEDDLTAGVYTLRTDGARLPAGWYAYLIQTDGETVSAPCIKR